MKVELREKENGTIRFLLTGTTPAFANSIRRTVLQEIPIMAVDEVEFMANDSVIQDEVIAHRLGQMPLNTPEGYLLTSECDCREGRCPNCSVDLSLEVEGPTVTKASDLSPSDTEVYPIQEDSSIARLAEGEKLKLNAIARLGFGKDHANWQPAVASYKYMPLVEIDQDGKDDWTECADACPEKILTEEEGDLKVTDVEKCTMCGACEDVCPEAIEVSGDPSKFIFTIESTGTMPPERIVEKALTILEEKCSEFSENIEKWT